MRDKTKVKYDAFVNAYMLNDNNGAEAAVSAGYSEKSARQTATKLLTNGYICDELTRLKLEASKKAVESYSVTLERRLEWLNDIVIMGMEKHADMQGNMKPHSLPASTGAIAELNKMLGTTDNESDATALNINFTVSEAVAEVKVTNATA